MLNGVSQYNFLMFYRNDRNMHTYESIFFFPGCEQNEIFFMLELRFKYLMEFLFKTIRVKCRCRRS